MLYCTRRPLRRSPFRPRLAPSFRTAGHRLVPEAASARAAPNMPARSTEFVPRALACGGSCPEHARKPGPCRVSASRPRSSRVQRLHRACAHPCEGSRVPPAAPARKAQECALVWYRSVPCRSPGRSGPTLTDRSPPAPSVASLRVRSAVVPCRSSATRRPRSDRVRQDQGHAADSAEPTAGKRRPGPPRSCMVASGPRTSVARGSCMSPCQPAAASIRLSIVA